MKNTEELEGDLAQYIRGREGTSMFHLLSENSELALEAIPRDHVHLYHKHKQEFILCQVNFLPHLDLLDHI